MRSRTICSHAGDSNARRALEVQSGKRDIASMRSILDGCYLTNTKTKRQNRKVKLQKPTEQYAPDRKIDVVKRESLW